MANLFNSIKCLIVEAYTVVCLSTTPILTAITPVPTEVTTSVPAPEEVSTSGAIVHVPAGTVVLYTAMPIVSVTTIPATLSSEGSAQLSEWNEDVWLASEIGQEVEEMVRQELFHEEYFREIRAARKERKLADAVAEIEANEASRPTSFSWDEWNGLTLAEKAVAPLPAKVCATVGTGVYTALVVAGGAAIYALGVVPMSAGMALVAFLGTMYIAPVGVIAVAIRIAGLNGLVKFVDDSYTDDSYMDD